MEAAYRYVEFMGGADAVVAKARQSYDAGDFRWVAEVLNHVVFAQPEHERARELLADTYEQLGYGAENGTWRSAYLSAAYELRHGIFGTPVATSAEMLAALSPEQVFDAIAIRVNGPRCWHEHLTLDLDLTGSGTRYRLTLRNGVLIHTTSAQNKAPDAVLHLPATAFPAVATGAADPTALAAVGVTVEGDPAAIGRLLAALDAPDPDFAIVTP